MVKYQDFMVFFTFLLLWISIQFGQVVEDSIAYVIVLSIGIIHGSNDFTLLKKEEKSRKDFVKLTIVYVLLMLLCVAVYLINSFVAILFFIFLSSYHFGEQHLEHKIGGSRFINRILYIFYGLLIFSMIFIENIEDVDEIMFSLSGGELPLIWIKGTGILSFSILMLAYIYKKVCKISSELQIIRELFYVLLLYLVFKTSSLILGFAIYFIFWHSIPSILDQIQFLSGDQTSKTIFNYVKTAFIYWLISLAGLGITYYYFSESLFSSVIFLVLFAVTAPHVWVMNRMK